VSTDHNCRCWWFCIVMEIERRIEVSPPVICRFFVLFPLCREIFSQLRLSQAKKLRGFVSRVLCVWLSGLFSYFTEFLWPRCQAS